MIPHKITVFTITIITIVLFSTIIIKGDAEEFTIIKSKIDTDYYFGSLEWVSDPESRIMINVKEDSSAFVSMTLNAIPYTGLGIRGDVILPISFSNDQLKINFVGIGSRVTPTQRLLSIEPKYFSVEYQIVSSSDLTNIIIKIPEHSRKGSVIYVEYEVDRTLVDGEFTFPISSYTTITDLLTVVIFEKSDSIIEYDSVKTSPPPSIDTYSLARSEIGRTFAYYVFEDVRSTTFNLNLNTLNTVYHPEYFIHVSSILAFLATLSLSFIFRPIEKRANFFTLAFRDFSREKSRYMMAVIGVSIYSALLSSTVIQSQVLLREVSIALGIEHAPEIEPYLFLAITISVVVGSFLILNSILTSFLERINEFGIMKAIGFSPSFFFKLTIFESAIIGVIGGLLGCSLGVFLSLTPYITFRTYLPLNYPSNLHFTYVIALTTIGLLVGRVLGKQWKIALICGILAALMTFFTPLAAVYNASTIPVTSIMSDTLYHYFLLLISSVVLSVISGLYPAFWISRIQPVDAIRKTV